MSYLDRDTYVDWTPSGRRGNLMCARTTPGQISKICPVRRRATRASCYPAERTPENPRVSCIHIPFKTKVRITAVKREAYIATYLASGFLTSTRRLPRIFFFFSRREAVPAKVTGRSASLSSSVTTSWLRKHGSSRNRHYWIKPPEIKRIRSDYYRCPELAKSSHRGLTNHLRTLTS